MCSLVSHPEGKTYVRAEGSHVHLLSLCAHGGLVGEDGLHDEGVGKDDDSGWEEEVEHEDNNVVTPSLFLGEKKHFISI